MTWLAKTSDTGITFEGIDMWQHRISCSFEDYAIVVVMRYWQHLAQSDE